MGRGDGDGAELVDAQIQAQANARQTNSAPSLLARTVASVLWGPVQRQTQIGKGVYNFSTASHGGVVAVVGEADIPEHALQLARKHGLTELVAEVKQGRRSRRYSSIAYKREALVEMAQAYPQQVSLSEVWVGEEDAGWATIFKAIPQLTENSKNKGIYSPDFSQKYVDQNLSRWSPEFLADIDPAFNLQQTA